MARGALLAAAALALPACDDVRPPCMGPFVTVRNPDNLACVERQLASPDCPDIAPPTWAQCPHPCEAIRDEATCAAMNGCRVARELCDIFDDRCQTEGPFLGCFPINRTAPAEGACADLTAAGPCATRDDCGAQYLRGPDCGPAARADGPDCHLAFNACYDELTPP